MNYIDIYNDIKKGTNCGLDLYCKLENMDRCLMIANKRQNKRRALWTAVLQSIIKHILQA